MKPETRTEIYLNAIAGDGEVPANMTPLTREEYYLSQILERVDQMAQNGGSGGGGVSPLICTPSLSGSIFSLDKTFKEIKEAFEAGSPIHILDELVYTTVTIIMLQSRTVKDTYGNQFTADSDDGYPYFEV